MQLTVEPTVLAQSPFMDGEENEPRPAGSQYENYIPSLPLGPN